MDLLAPLFSRERQTNIPLIYSGKHFVRRQGFPLWVSLIGPSGAGKDTIKNLLLRTNKFAYVRTATNRLPRKDENPRDYIWMRAPYEREPLLPYLRSLIKQYDLLEFNFHYGNMYGTPLESIREAILTRKIPFYCSENQGALFMEQILSPIFDVLIISVIPNSLKEMKKRIHAGDRNNPQKRIEESLERIRTASQTAHYIVKNSSVPVEHGKSGLESAVSAVKQLLATYS